MPQPNHIQLRSSRRGASFMNRTCQNHSLCYGSCTLNFFQRQTISYLNHISTIQQGKMISSATVGVSCHRTCLRQHTKVIKCIVVLVGGNHHNLYTYKSYCMCSRSRKVTIRYYRTCSRKRIISLEYDLFLLSPWLCIH